MLMIYIYLYVVVDNSSQRKNRAVSEATGSTIETPRRAGTPHESIHSSSDREHMSGPPLPPLKLPRETDDGLKDVRIVSTKFLGV